jgi:Spy/CpxP family protein refolding chaperone
MTVRSVWWAALALLGVLCSGIVLGVAADRLWLHRGARDGRGPMMSRGPGFMRGPPTPEQRRAVSARIRRELSLTPEQSTQVDAVLTRQFDALEALHREVQPRFDSVFRSSRAAIDSVLTPEQRATREKLFRERWRGRRGGPEGRGGRDGAGARGGPDGEGGPGGPPPR